MGITPFGLNVAGSSKVQEPQKLVDFSVVMRAVGRARMHKDVELSLKIVALPEKFGVVPAGCWGWSVVEYDPHDGHEAIVVGGIKPSALEAAMMGQEALQCEINQRKLPALITQAEVLDEIARGGR